MSNANLGDYTISAVDGGKATSIVSNTKSLIDFNSNSITPIANFRVGTVGASGAYFPLASGGQISLPLADVALAPNKTYQFFQVQDGSIADVQQQIASGKVIPDKKATQL